jgi:hypothetical protein
MGPIKDNTLRGALGLFGSGGPEDQGPPTEPLVPLAPDRLAYMADLLTELKDMADAEGRETLAGLLSLARAEALRKSG